MNTRRDIDTRKRKTLKTFGGLGVGAALASLPVFAAAASANDSGVPALSTVDLELTLISSPDVLENTLIIKNTSQQTVTIETLHANYVAFDGDIIDCNGCFAEQALSLQAGEERAFYVSRLDSQISNTSAFDYLHAQAATSYLPQGTRVVSLGAKVYGNAGYLNTRPNTLTV